MSISLLRLLNADPATTGSDTRQHNNPDGLPGCPQPTPYVGLAVLGLDFQSSLPDFQYSTEDNDLNRCDVEHPHNLSHHALDRSDPAKKKLTLDLRGASTGIGGTWSTHTTCLTMRSTA
ncbi:hypothetical protein C8F04DRAFT_1274649 [Mycena alexandri]|uniref:Uncharacterized protein n=1 Tax=Mycena alexandri TaxID=1745969 RepID=A0AAD6S558_9AGAR|nr:hypothetical protein C8F04DRAFT_1274649 [Mycena alexandri]